MTITSLVVQSNRLDYNAQYQGQGHTPEQKKGIPTRADMRDFLLSLHGRLKVQVVCIEMNSAYRRLVHDWFLNAGIVADSFMLSDC